MTPDAPGKTPSLNYTTTPRRWSGKRWIIALVVLLAALLIPFPTGERATSMDHVTGSTVTVTTYPFPFSFKNKTVRYTSPIERRLTTMNAPWTPNVRFVHGQYLDLFGERRGNFCGRAPAIYALGSAQSLYVASATNAEVMALVNVLQTGPDTQQEAAVEAAFENVLAH